MPAQNVLSDLNEAVDDPWIMTCLQRADGPPLRFKGQLLSDRENGDVFAQIWQRKKGGMVLCYADFHAGNIRPHALVLDDYLEVALFLEDLCRFQLEVQQSGFSDMAFGQLLVSLRYTQLFHPIVGELLNDVAVNTDARPINETDQEAT